MKKTLRDIQVEKAKSAREFRLIAEQLQQPVITSDNEDCPV